MQIKNDWIKVGALIAALGVVLGGLDLQNYVSSDIAAADGNQQLAKAVQFQLIHALAIVLTGIIMVLRPGRLLHATAWIFLAGILLFSGSIYLALDDWNFMAGAREIRRSRRAAGWLDHAR